MRASLFAAALALCACGEKPPPRTSFDEDLSLATPVETGRDAPPAAAAPRADAPPGKGLRTGTISRERLVAVLDGGPGQFLRQLEVTPHMLGDRFVGWELVQLLGDGPLHDLDVAPGDVLVAVNGRPLSRPDQLEELWDSLRTANEVVADVWRGTGKLQLRFAIEPKVGN
ncbi:MAG TPA: hypothetical protein VLX92_35010 [Kofleriaceae bacterium]|nr:hypothetical protein [Kofleriaceae bacterium]